MVFTSFSFALFFLCVLGLCIIVQQLKTLKEQTRIQLRNIILLIGSYYFYAFLKWEFAFLLLFTTLVNYLCSIQIEINQQQNKLNKSKRWMWVAVITSIGLLGYFKYTNFFIDSINDALHSLGIGMKMDLIKIVLPIGISFFTFQALTYTLDVYKQKIKVSRNFVDVALFVSFFPTILSGPIERARNLLPQLETTSKINGDSLVAGGKLFLWGLFKKMVIADRLGDYINVVYSFDLSTQSSITLIVTTILYSFQIYADFSGYSDMAIGVARAFGFKLGINFNYPYFSTSIKEFWKKWHISLTSWFSEYVYIPLGGNRVSHSRYLFNISAIFLLSGLWHGANWAFIIWGALHAIYYIIEYYYKKTKIYILLPQNKITHFISMLVVFIFVALAWIFFRLEDTQSSLQAIKSIFVNSGSLYWGISAFTTALTCLLLIVFLVLDWIRYKEIRFNPIISSIGYSVILILVLLCSVSNSGFVYFQF